METSTSLTRTVPRARVARLLAAAALGLSLSVTPAFAAEEAPAGEGTEAEAGHGEEEGSGKIQLAETPRDRVGLIMLGVLGAITVGGALTASRQLRGKRPQATGEFRWR